jgi:hypothetical protein
MSPLRAGSKSQRPINRNSVIFLENSFDWKLQFGWELASDQSLPVLMLVVSQSFLEFDGGIVGRRRFRR